MLRATSISLHRSRPETRRSSRPDSAAQWKTQPAAARSHSPPPCRAPRRTRGRTPRRGPSSALRVPARVPALGLRLWAGRGLGPPAPLGASGRTPWPGPQRVGCPRWLPRPRDRSGKLNVASSLLSLPRHASAAGGGWRLTRHVRPAPSQGAARPLARSQRTRARRSTRSTKGARRRGRPDGPGTAGGRARAPEAGRGAGAGTQEQGQRVWGV